MERRDMLQMLENRVCQCEKCPEMLLSRSKTVFGEGNPNASVVFCGEAPGKTEDKEGRPFCGEAGRLLDNIIKACGWKREDVYILNTVKCHPDNNRVPSPEEVTNCRPYLDLQLKVINPRVIVCLGATAAQNLLGRADPVNKLRNSWYDYVNEPVKAKVRVTFHPAYLLRNPGDKSKVWDDMREVLKEVNKWTLR